MKKLFILGCAFFFVVQIGSVQAVDSNAFNVRVALSGADSIAPSTPVLLTAAPIAATQIDLTWSVSTDNFMLAGYVVVRDGLPIATTTLHNYSDAGLAASTTYSYVIRAFDPALNYSSSSNSLATTTSGVVPPVPPLPPSSTSTPDVTSTESTIARVVLRDFSITTGVSTTSLQLTTALPARIEVRWGKTASYELGYVVREIYSKDHSILLTELEPGTKYNYEVIGYTPYGQHSVLKSGWFQTLDNEQVFSPVNVNRFQATAQGEDVKLSWQLPTDDKFAYVRIVRSYIGFPDYPQAGAVVYQGTETGVVDVGILAQYSPAYYTAFVYDIFGNVSSGAVAMAYAENNLVLPNSNQKDEDKTGDNLPQSGIQAPIITAEATSSVSTNRVTVDMKMPQAAEIKINQTGEVFDLSKTNISLNSDQSFVISIPYHSIAGNLKSIIATVLDPTDNRQVYSFLLRVNKDQTAYEATIAPLMVIGSSQIKVAIYDYEAFVVATYQAPLQFVAPVVNPTEAVVFPDQIYKYSQAGLIALVILSLMTLFYFLVRRRTEDKT
ncbi:MAG: hypothetical protein RLZZ230_77 [Candidatus Parcubacteria bacterium]|jgi:hypothetical protein